MTIINRYITDINTLVYCYKIIHMFNIIVYICWWTLLTLASSISCYDDLQIDSSNSFHTLVYISFFYMGNNIKLSVMSFIYSIVLFMIILFSKEKCVWCSSFKNLYARRYHMCHNLLKQNIINVSSGITSKTFIFFDNIFCYGLTFESISSRWKRDFIW